MRRVLLDQVVVGGEDRDDLLLDPQTGQQHGRCHQVAMSDMDLSCAGKVPLDVASIHSAFTPIGKEVPTHP